MLTVFEVELVKLSYETDELILSLQRGLAHLDDSLL